MPKTRSPKGLGDAQGVSSLVAFAQGKSKVAKGFTGGSSERFKVVGIRRSLAEWNGMINLTTRWMRLEQYMEGDGKIKSSNFCAILHAMNGTFLRIARLSLATIYIWFGILKVIGVSPANPLVASLLEHTMPFVSFDTFSIFFGVLEVIIGVLFLLPTFDRITPIIFGLHMATTFLPLLVLPHVAWSGVLIPTIEGQYIVKNIALLALAYGIYGGRVR